MRRRMLGALSGAVLGGGLSTLAACGDQTTRPAFEAIQARFNEQKAGRYVASLNLISSAEYIDKTLASLAADSPSDVFLTYAQYKPAWVKKGLLLDTTDRWKTSRAVNVKMYYPPVADAITYQGKQWGTPWGYNATVMFFVVTASKSATSPSLERSGRWRSTPPWPSA
jgi:ABC-type glycerol-3-phosphate transport system substrate-binding protein